MDESTKALYDEYPEDEKSDFFSAFVYMKYIDHFMHHALLASGLSPQRARGASRSGD